ncbi:MAG: hypothetical protein P1U90_05210 [Akkermansiaceae bacterium]|jgi:glucan phosphoethanolaminetransferase (alkaline phosphatase superfamily)|nr:hypothetical protein [Akkermansiaceae bacterium]
MLAQELIPITDDEGNYTLLGLIWIGFIVWLSLAMILRMWIKHREAHIIKKIFWTIILMVPIIGAVFYVAFFKRPGSHNLGGGDGGMPAGGASGGY